MGVGYTKKDKDTESIMHGSELIDDVEAQNMEQNLEGFEKESLIFRLWLKNRDKHKKNESEPGKRRWGKNANKEETEEFVRDVSVEQGSPEWVAQALEQQDSLQELWKQSGRGHRPKGPYGPFDVLMKRSLIQEIPLLPSMDQSEEEMDDITRFYSRLQHSAKLILSRKNIKDAYSLENASLQTYVTDDEMSFWVFAFPPQGGLHLTMEQLQDTVNAQGVVHGIDQDLMERMVRDRLYFQILPVALGERPVNGEDGKIIECIPRESVVSMDKREDGSVDYKSGGKTRLIKKGDMIMRIQPPGEGQNGVSVKGKRIQALVGKPAVFPRIANTVIIDDGSALVSKIDGHIYFEDNRFIVESLLVISGNVDGTVGNVEYGGDVRIEGDVQDGFQVKASGNIQVMGMVEDAQVYSGGSITVGKGMNGNNTGVLDAKNDVRSKYLENCIVRCGGDIYADSIIWSDIFCKGNMHVTSQRGVIIGGKCVVLGNIEAQTIGNASRRPIEIVLGSPPDILSRRDKLEMELTSVQAELANAIKDLAYLEARITSLSDERQQIYKQLRLRKPILQMKERKLTQNLAEVYQMISEAHKSMILCDQIYPPAKISIGTAMQQLSDTMDNCKIFAAGDKIIFGHRS